MTGETYRRRIGLSQGTMYGIASNTECKRSDTVLCATRSKTVDESENDSLLWQTTDEAEKLRKAQKRA